MHVTFSHASVMIAMFSQDITDVCSGQEVEEKRAKPTEKYHRQHVNTVQTCLTFSPRDPIQPQ